MSKYVYDTTVDIFDEFKKDIDKKYVATNNNIKLLNIELNKEIAKNKSLYNRIRINEENINILQNKYKTLKYIAISFFILSLILICIVSTKLNDIDKVNNRIDVLENKIDFEYNEY